MAHAVANFAVEDYISLSLKLQNLPRYVISSNASYPPCMASPSPQRRRQY